ncbi:glycosyltransferase [Candidatus Collierbacteria bacterium]|nr:glycosyltransferase [Candidatus Collierbacteria bacterium]
MRVALVYDRVNKFGGAERLIQAIAKIYPKAPLYTLVCDQDQASWANNIKVIPTFFNKLKYFRSRHELLAPLAGLAFETHDLSSFDLVISITSAEAKAVLTKPETLHLCYLLTPTRYLWSHAQSYRKNSFSPFLFNQYIKWGRRADLVYAARPDHYLAISKTVKKRIKKYYQRKSTVIYPPVDLELFANSNFNQKKDKSYLLVSRLVPYKNIDLVIKAFNHTDRQLIIAGTGREYSRLKRLANPSRIKFLSFISDVKLQALYRQARAVIFPQKEDFGLVPLEAQAAGCPVIAFQQGGATETVIAGKTGLFFAKPTVSSLNRALAMFESGRHQITSSLCLQNARKFSEPRFAGEFSAKVNKLWQSHQRRIHTS